jgi:hypothetical protein
MYSLLKVSHRGEILLKKILNSFILLLLTLSLMACSAKVAQTTELEVADSYLAAMEKQDIETMVNLLDPNFIEEITEYLGTSKEDLIQNAEKSKDQKILKKYEIIGSEDGEEGRKVVNVKVTIVVDGVTTEKEAQIQVLQRDNKWWVIAENI